MEVVVPMLTWSLSKSTITTSSSKFSFSVVGSNQIKPIMNGKGARRKSIIPEGRRGMKTCSCMVRWLEKKCIPKRKAKEELEKLA